MDNKLFSLLVFIICFGFVGIIFGIYWMIMCLDYKEQVEILEQEIIDYRWQIEQVPYICECGARYE